MVGANATTTIIDGSLTPAVSVVKFQTSETRSAQLRNLTVKGANNTSSLYGGGIYISSASPTIQDVIITGNTAYYGGAAYITGSSASPLFYRNLITANNGYFYSGAVHIAGGTPEFSGNTLTANVGSQTGIAYGGAFGILGGAPYIHNNLIGSNPAYRGGGAYLSGTTTGTRLHNNLFTSNSATGGSTLGGHLYIVSAAYASIQNNVFQYAKAGGGITCSPAPPT